MKLLSTALLCLVLGLKVAAQQIHPKVPNDSLFNRDPMPTLKDRGTAIDIPTRKGRGDVVDMPTHKVGSMTSKEFDISNDAMDQLKRLQEDSSGRAKSRNGLSPNKKGPH